MNKVTLNYWGDVLIAVSFVVSAITGLAFLVMGSSGYQGGRTANFATTFLLHGAGSGYRGGQNSAPAGGGGTPDVGWSGQPA